MKDSDLLSLRMTKKILILLLFLISVVAINGQAIGYNNLNGLTWQVVNSPINEVFNFQYNEVRGCNQLIMYKNGNMSGRCDYVIFVNYNQTFLRFNNDSPFQITQTYWDRGLLVGVDLQKGNNGRLEIRRQTSTDAPYFYGLD